MLTRRRPRLLHALLTSRCDSKLSIKFKFDFRTRFILSISKYLSTEIMVMCAVALCNSNNNKECKAVESNLRYFSFPSDKILRRKWVQKCYRFSKFNVNNARICSRHFVEEDYLLKHRILNEPFCKWKLKKGTTKIYIY